MTSLEKRLVLALTASLVVGIGLPALGQEPSEVPDSPAPSALPTTLSSATDEGAGVDFVQEASAPAGEHVADAVSGTVGLYRMFDSPADPSTICAYPVDGARLAELVARGPRVDFPSSVGEVGWVTWQLLVQRKLDDDTWKTIERTKKLRRTVGVGFSVPFKTQPISLTAATSKGRIRLVGVLEWFDQGDRRVGKARHIIQNYGWDRYRFDPYAGTDLISFDQVERGSVGSCPSRWAP